MHGQNHFKFTIHICISVTALYMQWQNNKEVYYVRSQFHFCLVVQVATLEATSFLVCWRAVWTIFPSSCIVYLMYSSCCTTFSFFSSIGLFWRRQICWYKFQQVVFTFTTKERNLRNNVNCETWGAQGSDNGGYYFLEHDMYVDTNISDEPAASSFSVEDREEGVEKSWLPSTKIHNTTFVMESAKSISLPLCSNPDSI